VTQANLSPEEIQSLKDLANPDHLRAVMPARLRAKLAILGYGEQKLGRFAITEKGRRILWDLAGRRGH
jgi:hypothetical protein